MTTIKVKTPYFGDRPYEAAFLQTLIPFTIISVVQGSFEFTMTVEETLTQAQVDALVSDMKAYVLANLITAVIL